MSDFVALIIQMMLTFSQNVHVTLQGAFETTAQINKKLKRMDFDDAFCKIFKFLINRLEIKV